MARLWGSLGRLVALSLLLTVQLASADALTVNTTEDVLEDDDQCSLREALAYFATRPLDLGDDESYAYLGCAPASGDSSSSDSISLPKGTFEITRPLVVSSAVTITGVSGKAGDDNETIIKPAIDESNGLPWKIRLFLIDDATSTEVAVTFSKLALVGGHAISASTIASGLMPGGYCGSSAAAQGGAICNREALTLDAVQLRQNQADTSATTSQGGAVYVVEGAIFAVTNVSFVANSAKSGAAIFAEDNSLNLQSSSFYWQCNASASTPAPASCAGSYVIHIDADTTSGSPFLENLTISSNQAGALYADAEIVINSSTIVANAAGIDFTGKESVLDNSILAGNLGDSCVSAAVGGFPEINYSLLDTGDCSGATLESTYEVGGAILLAASGASVTDSGLLSALRDNGGEVWTHKPRLALSLSSLDDVANVIVDRGNSSGTTDVCPSSDARGKERQGNQCDIGAVEFQFSANTKTEFKAVSGESVLDKSFLAELGDAEAVPNSDCAGITYANANFAFPYTGLVTEPRFVALRNSPYVGCMVPVDLGADVTKGLVTYDAATSTFDFTPYSAFHGVGRFRYLMTSTSSRLNADPNLRYVVVDSAIVAEPASGLSSSTLDLGGATDELFLLVAALMGLRIAGQRRGK